MTSSVEKIDLCFLKTYPSVMEGIFSLTGISKSQLKKYKMNKAFLSKPVKARDEISLPINLVNHGRINPIYSGKKVKTIFEDDILLALSKPVQVHSHPLSYDEKDNLLSAMSENDNYAKLLGVNPSQYDRGLMYRLDYETSGLMIYCKTEDVYQELRENFHNAVLSKEYLVIVEGQLLDDKRVTHYLVGAGANKQTVKAYDSDVHKGRRAEIAITVLKYNEEKDLTLIKVKLKQGHRHQIRVQLQAIGHSILGDKLYSRCERENSEDRLYLHCLRYQLRFVGKTYDLEDSNIDLFKKLFNFNC